MRQPPEKLLTGCSSSETLKPRPRIRAWARGTASCAPASARSTWAWAMAMPSSLASAAASWALSSLRRVSPSSTNWVAVSEVSGMFCATWPRRHCEGMENSPPSSARLPLSRANRLDLPAPLRPTRPTFSPGLMETEVLSSSTRVPRRRVMLRRLIMNGQDYPSDCARAVLPPAMPVPGHGAKPWYQALDRLYAHALHHGLGELDLALETLGIGVGAGDGDLAAFLLQQGDDPGLPEHLLQRRAQPLDDGLGRGGRHGHAAPGREVDIGHAQLGQGLHLGQLGVALRPGNGQRHQLAGQHLGIGHGKQRGAERYLLAQHGIDQLGRALVGHMVDLQAHAGGQHLHAQVRRRANAARGIRSEEHTSELQSPCNLVCR